MNIKKYDKGFTLIELLVVISIIGVLSSVVVAAVSTARAKGQVAAGLTFSDNTKAAFYPTDNSTPYVYLDLTNAVQGSGATIINNGPTSGSVTTLGANITFPADTTLHKIGQYMLIPTPFNNNYLDWTESGTTIQNAISNAGGNGNFTFAFWFNPNGNTGTCGGSCPLFGNDGGSGTERTVVNFINGVISADIDTVPFIGETSGVNGYTLPSLTQWTHIALSVKSVYINPNNVVTASLYINGNLVATNTINKLIKGNEADGNLYVGGDTGTGLQGASYDDVAFYGRTLLSSDIHNLYAEGLAEHTLASAQR